MAEYEVNPIKYVVIVLLFLGIIFMIFLLPFSATTAADPKSGRNNQQPNFSESIASGTLCSAGLGGCELASNRRSSGGLFASILGGGTQRRAVIDPVITIVNVPDQTEFYRIIGGKKHLIPNTEIFYSYNLSPEIVQQISAKELDKYPMAKLFTVASDESNTIYYLTGQGMIRPILNDKVFDSYGNRKEDVIMVNQKEFNYYPRNQYIFVDRPQVNRDIYQITGGIKRYLTPVAIRRMKIKESEIAPVSQIEFDAYPSGQAVIF